jgi:hypothetical protein
MNRLKKLVSTLLCWSIVLQPALAVEQQYRIPLRSLSTGGNNHVDPSGGSSNPIGDGAGDVDVDAGASPPAISFKPDSLQFDVTRDTDSVHSTLLMNNGESRAKLSKFTSNQNFKVSSSCPAILPAGESCMVVVTRAPYAESGAKFDMNVLAPGAARPAVLHLSTYTPGEGATVLGLSQDIVDLGQVDPGVATSGSAVLTNLGTSTVNLRGIGSSGPFHITSDCPDNLAPGASCNISVMFVSHVGGEHTYQMNLKGSAEEDGVPLTFRAKVFTNPAIAPALSFSTDSLSFEKVPVGQSAPQSAKLSNPGSAPAYLNLAKFASTPDFDIKHDCPDVLEAKSFCTFNVSFKVAQRGISASHALMAEAQNDMSTMLVLMGSGEPGIPGDTSSAIAAEPSLLQFGDVLVGQSVQLTSKVTNISTSPVTVNRAEVTAEYGGFVQSNDCSAPLQPGASCTVTITFKPTLTKTVGGGLGLGSTGGGVGIGFTGTGRAAVMKLSRDGLDYGLVTAAGPLRMLGLSVANTGNMDMTGFTVVNTDPRLAVDASRCNASILPLASCDLLVHYSPASDGPFKTSFQLKSDNGGIKTVEVSGTIVRLAISPSSIDYETQQTNSYSDRDITVVNEGQRDVALDGITLVTLTGGFSQSNNCGNVIKAGASCTIVARFGPGGENLYSASVVLSVAQNAAGVVHLKGEGAPSKLEFSSNHLRFPETNVGKTSPALSVIVTNPTDARISFTGISVVTNPREFGQSNNCDQGLDAGASCTITAQWTPIANPGQDGMIGIASSSGAYAINMSGMVTEPVPVIETPTGGGEQLPPPVITPDAVTHFSIKFLDTEVDAYSAVRHIKFSNKGTGPLTVQGVSIATGAGDFNQSNDCAEPVMPGGYCTISMVFRPSQIGTRTGSAVLVSDFGTYSFDLSGKGLGPLVQLYAESSSDYGQVLVGSTNLRKFIFQNTSATPANKVQATLTANAATLVENTCGTAAAPTSVAAGASCYMTVKYAPTVRGDLEATLAVASDASNGVQNLVLSGYAAQSEGQLTANTSTDFGEVAVGTTSTLKFTLTNTGDFNMTDIGASVTGTGMSIVSNGCGAVGSLGTMGPGKICTVTVQFAPKVVGAAPGKLTISSSAANGVSELVLSATGAAITSKYALLFNGANGSTTISDTGTGSAWYSYNGASQTTQFYREGTASLSLNGVNQAVFGPAIDFTEDFAVSAWVRPTALSGALMTIVGKWNQNGAMGGWLLNTDASGALQFYWAPYSVMGPMMSVPGVVKANTWTNVAVTRQGTSFSLYVNGTKVATTTNAGNLSSLNVPVAIGSYYTGSGTLGANTFFNGKIDDVRITTGNGAANFTAPAQELTVTDTDFGAVSMGNPTVRNVTVRNNTSWPVTVDSVTSSGEYAVTDAANCTSKTLAPGALCTVSVTVTPTAVGVRPGTLTLKYDANGSQVVNLTGNSRITDPNINNVVLLMHMDGNTLDSSPTPKAISSVGSVSTSGAGYFGSGALSVADTSSGLVAGGQGEYAFAPGVDFTIEAFIKPTASATYKQIVGQWGSCQNSYQLSLYSGKLGWERPGYGTLTSSDGAAAVSLNAWHHVAVSRTGSTISLYVDGKRVASAADSVNYTTGNCGMGIGKVAAQNGYSFGAGFIDEVRITRQVARYSGATYTVPAQAFPNQ